MRLFLISYICGPVMTDAQLKQYTEVLEKVGCDMSPFQYIRRWKTFSRVTPAQQPQYGAAAATAGPVAVQ